MYLKNVTFLILRMHLVCTFYQIIHKKLNVDVVFVFVDSRNTVWRKGGPEKKYNKNNRRFFLQLSFTACVPTPSGRH